MLVILPVIPLPSCVTKTFAELLKKIFELTIHWFEDNYMKLNIDKCHLLISRHKYEHQWAQIGADIVWEENEVKLLGIRKENELKFDSYISNIRLKANKNLLSVLWRP